ncbi:hypothetical protein [Marseilla massiliensis]|uniref:hypothetical protein n=1 Tax=Marseilla massiliensis TaxID=1841864 RepID=UPI0030C80ECE
MNINFETKNKPVLSTRFVVEQNSPILYVYLDDDGDWQCLGGEEVDESDARIISIGELLELDPTLTTVPDLEKGESASRTNKQGQWQKD